MDDPYIPETQLTTSTNTTNKVPSFEDLDDFDDFDEFALSDSQVLELAFRAEDELYDGVCDPLVGLKLDEKVEEKFSNCEKERATGLNSHDNVDNSIPLEFDLRNEFNAIEEYFYTVAEATAWIKDYSRGFGYVLIKTSSNMKRKTPYVVFGCERCGKPSFEKEKPKGDENPGGEVAKDKEDGKGGRKRVSFTKKECCPFEIKLFHEEDGDYWFFKLRTGYHNHEPLNYPEGHAYLSRLTKEEREMVVEQTQQGLKPSNILKSLRKRFPDNCSNPKVIYNLRVEIKRKAREGRTVMQELFRLAEKENTIIRYTKDKKDQLKNFFWTFVCSNSIARSFPYVFIMDCTYKTNRYKLPLLHIVGVTSTGLSFSAGFALLMSEVEESFVWALQMFRESIGFTMPTCIITDKEKALMNAITKVFPDSKRLLCQWHIAKAVGVAAKRVVPAGEGHDDEIKKIMHKWAEIMSCKNDAQLERVMEEAKTWIDPSLIKYVEDTWITDFKDQFIAGWIDEVLHFGNTCTSRVEGMHAVLKGWLETPNLDLVSHWERVVDMAKQQEKNIKCSLAQSSLKRSTEYGGKWWTATIDKKVALRALELIHLEFKRSERLGSDVIRCGCVYRTSHGLPCAHTISLTFQHSKHIRLEDIHPYWQTLTILGDVGDSHEDEKKRYEGLLKKIDEKYNKLSGLAKTRFLDRLDEVIDPSTTSMREPDVKINNRGRPKGAKNKARLVEEESTKRDPSLFEIVDSQLAKRKFEALQKGLQASVKSSQQGVPKTTRKRKEKENESQTSDFDVPKVSKAKVSKKKIEVVKNASSPKVPKTTMISESHKAQVPQFMLPYLKGVIDVEMDGNCGYRAVAVQLGRDQEDWSDIRRELWEELNNNFEDYEGLFLKGGEALNIKRNLLWPKANGGCGSIKWMDTPNVLWIIAQRYNVPVSILSCRNGGSMTCLPYRTAPKSDNPKHIWLLFVNNNHYLSLEVDENCPLPTLQMGWQDHAREEAMAWLGPIGERLDIGTRLLQLEHAGIGPNFFNLGDKLEADPKGVDLREG